MVWVAEGGRGTSPICSNMLVQADVCVFVCAFCNRTFWMVEASVQMCICEIIMAVVLATQMDPVSGSLPKGTTIGLLVVVSAPSSATTN